MKLIVAGFVGTLTAESIHRLNRDTQYEDAQLESEFPAERKMKQLLLQLDHYRPGFDENQLRGYGCNCFMDSLGMTTTSYGKPVDALDASCRAYQDCLKCAKDHHGDSCFPDFTGYLMEVIDGEVMCKNNPKTCRRSLCECDKIFAKMQAANQHNYNSQMHLLGGYEPQDSCVRGGNPMRTDPQCCGGNGSPFVVFNARIKDCCANGRVAAAGTCPPPPPTTTKPRTRSTTTTTAEVVTTAPVAVTTTLPLPPMPYGKRK